MEPLTYTIPEAAALLGISRRHAYVMARRGELPTLRFGGRILVPRGRLHRLIDGDETAQAT